MRLCVRLCRTAASARGHRNLQLTSGNADITGSVTRAKEENRSSQTGRTPEQAKPRRRGVSEQGQHVSHRARDPRADAVAASGARSASARNRYSESLLEPPKNENRARGIEGSNRGYRQQPNRRNRRRRFKGITMYEGMSRKGRQVLERSRCPCCTKSPRRSRRADVRYPGLMQTEAAERLTVEMALRRAGQIRSYRRYSQDRRQSAAAKAQLARILQVLKSPILDSNRLCAAGEASAGD